MNDDATPPRTATQDDLARTQVLSQELLTELIRTAQRKTFPRNTIVVLE